MKLVRSRLLIFFGLRAKLYSNQDVATKNYVDTHAFTTAGVVVTGDIKLSVGSDLVRSLGCNDLSAGKKFALLLG